MTTTYRPCAALCATSLILTFCLALASESGAEQLPDKRPALIGSGPGALVNQIDTEGLFRKGQRDAWVMFEAAVLRDGLVRPNDFTIHSPDSKLLREEVRKRLRYSRFIPAVYNGRQAYAWFSGTVVYVVANGRPHLRVYGNQELDEIKRGTDFLAPQLVYDPRRGYILGLPDYPSRAYHGNTGALVKLRHSVDANGKTTDLQVISEQPAGEKYGEIAVKTVRMLEFLPGYRNGRPVASTYTLNWWFGRATRW